MGPNASRAAVAEVRLDLWLWAARFFKTRALAKQAIERGQVRIDGQASKPSRAVRIGLVLAIERAGERYEVEVRGLADQRGPASLAQQLYAESEASIAARLAEREKRRLEAQGYQPPGTRPNKRQRRLIQALGDLDAS
ncbi:MAG: RNA-binding protein [Xanthomonadaceae bacterium]|nr:RNA-binding protein [Xanthomonadaceae bacterium]